ncbi:TetR/AcrR family transcriptional regulator [Streptomyces sp. NPDC059373]
MAVASGAGSRPMRADARRNYDRLLEEARQAFVTHGSDVALEDIARSAGVGIGTLYRHFPDRTALMTAVFETELDALSVRGTELLTLDPPTEALRLWLRDVALHTAMYRGVAAILMASQNPFTAACRDRLRGSGGALLRRAQEAGEVREDTEIADLLKLTHAVLLAAEKSPEDRELFGRLMGLIMDGLRAKAG